MNGAGILAHRLIRWSNWWAIAPTLRNWLRIRIQSQCHRCGPRFRGIVEIPRLKARQRERSDRNVPGANSRCCGTDKLAMWPCLSMTTWLPRWRSTCQPARENAFTALAPEMTGSLGIKRQPRPAGWSPSAAFPPQPAPPGTRRWPRGHWRLLHPRCALGDTAGNGRAFRYDHARFVTFQRHQQLHILCPHPDYTACWPRTHARSPMESTPAKKIPPGHVARAGPEKASRRGGLSRLVLSHLHADWAMIVGCWCSSVFCSQARIKPVKYLTRVFLYSCVEYRATY